MPVKDLAVGIKVTADADQAEARMVRLKARVEGLTSAAEASSGQTAQLGSVARASAAGLDAVAEGAGSAGEKASALSSIASVLGVDLGAMGGQAQGAAGALGEARLALAGLSTGTVAAVAGVAALGAGFVAAVGLAKSYKEQVNELNGVIALAGEQSNFTASSLASDAQRIAAEAGQSYDDVLAALTGLIAGQKISATESLALADAGANLAATFGIDVAKGTDIVSQAFVRLGEGDVRALQRNFGFLDQAAQDNIIRLAGLGQTAAAQQALLKALGETLHGKPGSVSSAFGNAKSAAFDYAGELLNSFGPIKSAVVLLEKLAKKANEAADAIRSANASAAKGSAPRNTSLVQRDLEDSLANLRQRRDAIRPGEVEGSANRLRFAAALRRNKSIQSEFDSAVARDKSLREQIAKEQAEDADLPGQFERFNKERSKAVSAGSASPRKAGKSDAERDAEKRAREAAAAARELASDLANLTRAYDPLLDAQKKYEETLATITKLQSESAGASRISADQARAFTEAAAAELDAAKRADIDKLNRAYAVLGDNAARYAQVLREIAALEKRSIADGGIAAFEADRLRDAAKREKIEADIGRIAKDRLKDAASTGAKTLRDEGIASAQAVAKALGGNLGREASDFIGLLRGAQTGDFTSVSGKLGGILTLLSGKRDGEEPGGLAKGAADFGKGVADQLKKPLEKIFGEGGLFSKSLGSELGTVGEAFGTALAGAAFGKGATGALGLRGSKTGGGIGALAGKATGIAGLDVVGSFLGSAVFGAFKKPKTGSAALSFADGGFEAGRAVGNSSALRQQASAFAGSLSSRIESLADTLGGVLSGQGRVSVGFRKGQAVVDPTGQNRTKGKGVLKFGKGEEGQARAEAFAIADLIAQGAIAGLSDRVSSALRSSTDIEKAVREAVKVDDLEQLLAGFGAGTKKALVDFERQAKDRLRIATKFGFDLVKVEAETAKQRKALNDQLLDERTGSLKALLDDFRLGDRSGGSLSDRRAALLSEIRGLEGSAASDANSANRIAELLSQFDAVSLEANGTAGGQFASDRAQASEVAQRIIDQAQREIESAAAAARVNAGTASQSDTLIAQGNATLGTIAASIEEQVSLTAQMVSALGKITSNTEGGNRDDPFAAALAIGSKIF